MMSHSYTPHCYCPRFIGVIAAILLFCMVYVPARAVSRHDACMAVTAGAVYVASIAGANSYSAIWTRNLKSKLHEYSINSVGIYRTTPSRPVEDMLLGSPALGRIAAFVLDPVGEVTECIRPVKPVAAREFGAAASGPSPRWHSNFFLNISSVNFGAGLSLKYSF